MLTKEEAIKKLEHFCAYRERNVSEVRRKILQLGVTDESDISFIVNHLMAHNFLNEKRYIQAYVQGKINIKKWGKTKIRSVLKEQYIDSSLIENQLTQIDEFQYLQNLQLLLEKKWHSIKSEDIWIKKQKCLHYALQKGYEYDKISFILKKISK